MSKEYKDRTYVSFYPEAEYEGGAMQEKLIVNLPWNHETVWKMARKKALELGAKSFAMFEFRTGRSLEPNYDNQHWTKS